MSEAPDSFDVVIVGAGVAGLAAARDLKRAGKRVLILESSNRVGGRIMTLDSSTAGVPIELGAEFVHGDAPETTRLLDEARLATVPVTGKHYRSDRGELSLHEPMWKRMSRVFRHLNPDRKNDRSFQDFLDEKPGGKKLKKERELALGFVQGFNGADAALISEKSVALQGDPTEGAAEARRIVRGYSALTEFMQRDVAQDIRLSFRVRRIEWSESNVRVSDQNGSQHEARAVIVTVPLPRLQDSSIIFEPEIPTMRHAAQQLVMGDVVRLGVVVTERFWEKKIDDLSYLHSPTRPFNVWWTQHPLQAPLITGWSGGPAAIDLNDSGDVENIAIAELARVFGTSRKRIEKLVESIHTHAWTLDPDIRGAYSYAGIGGAYASRILARPFGRNVFFAGEATETGSGGTVEGAIVSGKRAARRLLRYATSD